MLILSRKRRIWRPLQKCGYQRAGPAFRAPPNPIIGEALLILLKLRPSDVAEMRYQESRTAIPTAEPWSCCACRSAEGVGCGLDA